MKMEEMEEKLAQPFDPSEVKWRVGSMSKDKTRAMALCYIDARCVMDRLDHVLGSGNWQSEVRIGPDGRVAVGIGVRIVRDSAVPWEWVWKWDGAGATQVEGDKGSISDGLKRAAVQWGVARYLYALDAPWVAVAGRSIAPSEQSKLDGILLGKMAAAKKPEMSTGGGTRESDEPMSTTKSDAAPGPAKFVTPAQKKQLYSANFKALEAIGVTKEEIEKMSFGVKFAPVNYATASVGVDRIDNLYQDQIDETLEHMRNWVRREREKKDKASDPPNDAAPDDDSFFDADHEL